MGKILSSYDELAKVVTDLRSQNKTIVTTNGAFDLFHVGHIKNLEFAKEKADILIVGLNSDSSIKKYKSAKRPVIPQDQRAKILSELRIVDYVIIFEEKNPINILNIIKPDFHVKGSEYEGDIVEQEYVEKNGGKVAFVKRDSNGVSTSKIIEKIKNEA